MMSFSTSLSVSPDSSAKASRSSSNPM
uniref:Calcium-dependent protein kinase 10-like n=1 Tax=Rhizophora mucronata TaxID=61149 RepID=A0A2P2N170_RHIMU